MHCLNVILVTVLNEILVAFGDLIKMTCISLSDACSQSSWSTSKQNCFQSEKNRYLKYSFIHSNDVSSVNLFLLKLISFDLIPLIGEN